MGCDRVDQKCFAAPSEAEDKTQIAFLHPIAHERFARDYFDGFKFSGGAYGGSVFGEEFFEKLLFIAGCAGGIGRRLGAFGFEFVPEAGELDERNESRLWIFSGGDLVKVVAISPISIATMIFKPAALIVN